MVEPHPSDELVLMDGRTSGRRLTNMRDTSRGHQLYEVVEKVINSLVLKCRGKSKKNISILSEFVYDAYTCYIFITLDVIIVILVIVLLFTLHKKL